MARHIPAGRKAAFYLGTVLVVLGFALAGWGVLSASAPPVDIASLQIRVFGGVALAMVGNLLRSIGTRGLAGAGVVLDPAKARRELEPYSRMAGGMVGDALEEANVGLGSRVEKVVMIKCPSCGKRNEDDSRFCQECGRRIRAE